MGVGMGLAMPTLSAASMASLPPEVRGVGSGSLNTMRQVGFTIGVALLVAIFTHTVAQNAQQATRQAMGFVAAQPQLSPAEKGVYSATILKNAKAAASSGGGAAVLTTVPAEGRPAAPGRDAGGADLAQGQRRRRGDLQARHRRVVQLALLRGRAGGAAGHHPGPVHRAPPGRATKATTR